jgi:serine/threonine-protein kinase
MPPARAVPLLEQLAQALDYAHGRGVVHRDLKASNVIVGPDGDVTLVDFGLAKVEGAGISSAGVAVGTPQYMAPEAIDRTESGASVDLYALGVLAYQMLTGRVPFDGSAMGVLYAHVHSMPPSPRSYRPTLLPAVENVLLRQLAKDQALRYPTALDFAAALRAAAMGAPPPVARRQSSRKLAPSTPQDPDRLVATLRHGLAARRSPRPALPVRWAVGAATVVLFLLVLVVGFTLVAGASAGN